MNQFCSWRYSSCANIHNGNKCWDFGLFCFHNLSSIRLVAWNHPKYTFKGTVHPKMNILWSLTHPRVIQNLYGFLSSVEHKQYLKNMTVAIDFHYISLLGTKNCWLPTFFKISSFVFSRRRRNSYKVNHDSFFNDYPFKCYLLHLIYLIL